MSSPVHTIPSVPVEPSVSTCILAKNAEAQEIKCRCLSSSQVDLTAIAAGGSGGLRTCARSLV